MYGKYPRSAYIAYHNPLAGREDEFNYWYNYIHVPDVLETGLFDRVYRYEAVGQAKARYLAIWESDYFDLMAEMDRLRSVAEKRKAQGRMWPVYEQVWSRPFSFIGPTKPPTGKLVTFITTNQTSCGNPGREQEYNQWYNTLHIPEHAATGVANAAYRYQRYDTPAKDEGQFVAIYETDLDSERRAAVSKEVAEKTQNVWYEQVGEGRLKIRQQPGQPKRPQDMVLETRLAWVGLWRPIWP